METSLVIMAAGMGSRFGGLKQIEPVSEDGRGILDFTVYDAKLAGFDNVVVIIREDMEEDFKSTVGARIEKLLPVKYVFQDLSVLPKGRTKPFGTAHAILCCKDAVKGSFVVVNADDYYGRNAFIKLHDHLVTAKPREYAMSSYLLRNTLSDNGTVSRGVCQIENGYLQHVNEVTKIDSNCVFELDGMTSMLDKDTPVSMNIWGFTNDIFDIIEEKYADFIKNANLMKDEFYIPLVVSDAVGDGIATVKVYENSDMWYGITYKEDLPKIKEAIGGYIRDGMYD